MYGYIVYAKDQRRGRLSPRNLLGLSVLEAVVPERRIRGALAARRFAAAMRRAGVRQAVFPRDFPYGEYFVRRGILPVEVLELYRRMAPLMVRHRMSQLELSASAATAAKRASLPAPNSAPWRSLRTTIRHPSNPAGRSVKTGSNRAVCRAVLSQYKKPPARRAAASTAGIRR